MSYFDQNSSEKSSFGPQNGGAYRVPGKRGERGKCRKNSNKNLKNGFRCSTWEVGTFMDPSSGLPPYKNDCKIVQFGSPEPSFSYKLKSND